MAYLKNLTIRQIRTLKAVVDGGNLARAAEKMHLTPPAISTALRTLEDQIGAEVLERTPAGRIKLNAFGQEIYQLAQELEGAFDRAEFKIEALHKGFGGAVRIGIVSTAKYIMPKIIHDAELRHPEIDIDLVIGNRQETIEALSERQVDFAIMGRPPREPAVEYIVIAPHPHLLIAPPNYPKVESIEDVTGEVFLVRENGSGTRMLFEHFINGFDNLPPIRRKMLSSNETIKQAVMAGLGIALISGSTIEAELEAGRISSIDFEGLPIMRSWHIVWNLGDNLTPAAQKIRQYIEENPAHMIQNQLGEPSL